MDLDDYTQKYLRDHRRNLSFEAILSDARRKQVLKSLKKYPHRNILEIGCALNPLFQYHINYESYTIVEPSKDFIQNAEKIAKGRNDINFIRGYMGKVDEKMLELDIDFDFIVLSSLLHEVPNPEELLKSVCKFCNKNTTVHINVPNVYSFHRLLAYEMGLMDSIFAKSETESKYQRRTRFNKQLLVKMVRDIGFEVLSQGTYFIKPFNNKQMEEIIRQGMVDKRVIHGLERMTRYMPDLGCEMFVDVRIIATAS